MVELTIGGDRFDSKVVVCVCRITEFIHQIKTMEIVIFEERVFESFGGSRGKTDCGKGVG